MSQFTSKVKDLEFAYRQKVEAERKVAEISSHLKTLNDQFLVMLEAKELLAAVSDSNTTAVLDYITSIINNTLGELFPYDKRRVYLEKNMHANQYAHIKVKVVNNEGIERDLMLQSGTGLRQVISFLFVISLIEIRKGRRILLMDELLSGLHPEAKTIVTDIMQIFAEEGFQFVMVEYGINDLGRLYLVEKPENTAYVAPLDGVYNDEIFVFHRPVEEVDMNNIEDVDETE